MEEFNGIYPLNGFNPRIGAGICPDKGNRPGHPKCQDANPSADIDGYCLGVLSFLGNFTG